MENLSLDGIIIIVVLVVIFFPIVAFLSLVMFNDWTEFRADNERHSDGSSTELEMKKHLAALLTVLYALFCILHLPPTNWLDVQGNLLVLLALAAVTFHFYREARSSLRSRSILYRKPRSGSPPPIKASEPKTAKTEDARNSSIKKSLHLLKVPPALYFDVAKAIAENPPSNPSSEIPCINFLTTILPPHGLISETGGGMTWGHYIESAFHDENTDQDIFFPNLNKLNSGLRDAIKKIPVYINIPKRLRMQHHHILGGTGHGKSSCIENMIVDDVKAGHSVVLIDSQRDIINRLATRLPKDKVVLVDPRTCPPALNIFDNKGDAATAIELFEYIFSALDSELSSKMSAMYRHLCFLLMRVPGANIYTLMELLEDGGALKYQTYVDDMGVSFRSFFNEYNKPRQSEYTSTRKHVLRRLGLVLTNPALEKMLGATENRLDIKSAIDTGKVVLISTDKDHMKQTAASLFGRIFMAQVMQAVMSRTDHRHQTFLYADEFQDYADDSDVLLNLFEQARKYNLGIVVAHQFLGKLPALLRQSMAANTAIKFVGGVSAQDSRSMASEMNTTAEYIDQMPEGTFAAYFKGVGVVPYSVEIGRVQAMPEITSLTLLQQEMRERYGVAAKPKTVTVRPADASRLRVKKPPPDNPAPEKSEW